jgi:hypothetical protein
MHTPLSPTSVLGLSIWALAVAPGPALAQVQGPTPTGAIGGVVVDTGGRRLAGAHLVVHAVQDPATPSNLIFHPLTKAADERGEFRFDSLPAGRIAIRANYIGMGRELDTVVVTPGQMTRFTITMREDLFSRLWRENRALLAADWQPTLLFANGDSTAPACHPTGQASISLLGDTIMITGCESFSHGFPEFRAHVQRYGANIVLDVVPVDDGTIAAIVFERRYRARIIVPVRARYVVYVRLNLFGRSLENENVTSRVVDLVEGRVGGT